MLASLPPQTPTSSASTAQPLTILTPLTPLTPITSANLLSPTRTGDGNTLGQRSRRTPPPSFKSLDPMAWQRSAGNPPATAPAAPAKAGFSRRRLIALGICLAITAVLIVVCAIVILMVLRNKSASGDGGTVTVAPTVVVVHTDMVTVTSTLTDGKTTEYATSTIFSTAHTVVSVKITTSSSPSAGSPTQSPAASNSGSQSQTGTSTSQSQSQSVVTSTPIASAPSSIQSLAADASAISAQLPFHPIASTSVTYQSYLADATKLNAGLILLDTLEQFSYRYALGRTVFAPEMLDYCTTVAANSALYTYQYFSLNFFDDANSTVSFSGFQVEQYTDYVVAFSVGTGSGVSVLLPPLTTLCSNPSVTGLWLDVVATCDTATGGDKITIVLFSHQTPLATAYLSVLGRSTSCASGISSSTASNNGTSGTITSNSATSSPTNSISDSRTSSGNSASDSGTLTSASSSSPSPSTSSPSPSSSTSTSGAALAAMALVTRAASGAAVPPQELGYGLAGLPATGASSRQPYGVLVVKQFGFGPQPLTPQKSGDVRTLAPFALELVVAVVAIVTAAVTSAGWTV
ncbi:hypothetical protein DFJ73DRAFT_129746 [Zopfochytrium polystomum]|nr:hypothetical protein DFJ73DRAFT_129746 [Zopfochytrium polystomum]